MANFIPELPPSHYLTADYYIPYLLGAIRIVAILLLAYIASALSRRLLRGARSAALRVMERSGPGSNFELEKRASTISSLLGKTITALVWVWAVIMILEELHFDVRPLLAGAGVVGLAIGFGAQTLVKDVLSGLFLLLENQIRVNDVVQINGQGGLVEETNLRTTVLRSEDGAVHFFPNGSITKISNLTREYSFYVFNVSVAYQEDTDRVVEVLRELGKELIEDEALGAAILAPLEIMGVDQLADSGVVIKARFKTMPLKQWSVGREMNRRIKKRFGEVGIEIPYPSRTVYFDSRMKEELKGMVQELWAEREKRRQGPDASIDR